ncbi:hypothetical protein D3C78_1640820 [compost metagenome]
MINVAGLLDVVRDQAHGLARLAGEAALDPRHRGGLLPARDQEEDRAQDEREREEADHHLGEGVTALGSSQSWTLPVKTP